VRHLRQVLFFAYKLETPYSKQVEEMVISSFVSVDRELETLEFEVPRNTKLITRDVFLDFDPKDILPRHGPGAVATGEKLEDKWLFSRKFSNIHQQYPYYDYFIVGGPREILDRLEWYKSLTPAESGVAKVVLVPKDSRGPRLISAEPLEYQWVQQGLGRKLVQHLESQKLTRGQINFSSQIVNQELALQSSISGEFATIDMKEASDRVSRSLVKEVFSYTSLFKFLDACRTTATRLPSGDVVPLNKFAPMGSALCFPIEAYVFWVLLVSHLISLGIPLRRAKGLVFVYGDDIIIPTEHAESSMQFLETFGLLSNRSKSYIKGSFRESCGVDAFRGVNVTPIRCKKPWTNNSRDGTCLSSYVSIGNSLSNRGYSSAASYVFTELEKVYGILPYTISNSGVIGRECTSYDIAAQKNAQRVRTRYNRRYQRVEVYCLCVIPMTRTSRLDSWPRLLRNQVFHGIEEPSQVAIPRRTQVFRRWRAL
jgi:hypothetical protein